MTRAFYLAAFGVCVAFAVILLASAASASMTGNPGSNSQVERLAQTKMRGLAQFAQAEQPPVPGQAPGLAETSAPARPLSSSSREPRELSPWSMFLSADALVKAVMICLAIASVITWTIFIAITFHLGFVKYRLKRAMNRLSKARTLSEAQLALATARGVLPSLLTAAISEIRASAGNIGAGSINERIAILFSEIVRAEGRAVRQGMGTLATIGAVSPFVGLFGTVWGIMNSFIGISKSQTTNLAVVAPGIAEALLATALGLVAAIPAVIIYNHFSRKTRAYVDLVGRASGAIRRLSLRDLDRAHSGMLSHAAE
jgi:biopolymer transport protein ExbB